LSRDSAQIIISRTAPEDSDLVQASKAGDSAAFEELVARYDRKLFRTACHILHNPYDAQDVVQDTFIKVFQNLGQFRADSKFSTWLYRIVVNQSLMELRQQRRKPATTIELSNEGDEEGRREKESERDLRPRAGDGGLKPGTGKHLDSTNSAIR